MTNPIWMPCEGGGYPGHQTDPAEALCMMCGRLILSADGLVVAHKRLDLLAMIERGDFDD